MLWLFLCFAVFTADFQSSISLEYFDFVGGKADFEVQCGATIASGGKFSSAAHEKASKVST